MGPARRSPSSRKQTEKEEADALLGEYRRKRDFQRTQEPAGAAVPGRGGRSLRFVIQKHAASSLHYDLRLELDGVMRSWAVPKGPSLDPADKRLAMQVEDHPIEYNTFEGTIPKGEYGGGTVMLWDRGVYHADEAKPGESDEDAVRRGLRAGKLSFTFAGERLRGSFALVRTSGGDKPKWLLIKHRDDDARPGADITAEVMTSVDSGRTMDEIAAGADRVWRSNRHGQDGGEEKASPRALEDDPVIAPMQPTPAREIPAGEWMFATWHGGERVLVYATPEAARLLAGTRDVTRTYRQLAAAVQSFAGRIRQSFVIEGEIDGDNTLHASDVLLIGDSVLMQDSWQERRKQLETLFHRRRIKGVRLQAVVEDGKRALALAARSGGSGVIAHRVDAAYSPGARSDGMLRIALH